MKLARGLFKILKEILRHLLRRPVVGINIIAKVPDGRIVMIRRGDTGGWALPGGTVEWGETLRSTAERELLEEAGITKAQLGEVKGIYSAIDRDPRFHAVTVVVEALVDEPTLAPDNPAEILEVGLFQQEDLPSPLSHSNEDMLAHVHDSSP
ncbi:MAG: NUDIX hydrolase, partial [Polyangiaceae bacterium]|nr:NUDIX hydrolase [Polyangiaceae bacterium]